MNVHQITDSQQYIQFLQEQPHELDLLFKELLIGVSSFFRDPEAFDVLAHAALPALLAAKSADDDIRVWVPGCASGEEAYSLGILLYECQERTAKRYKVQIFATESGQSGHRGRPPGALSKGLPPTSGPIVWRGSLSKKIIAIVSPKRSGIW